jgi:uncharacterized protein
MAKPSHRPSRSAQSSSPSSTPQVVDPRWLLQALAIVFIFAILCAYTTLCILYAHAQWQLVLHPSRTVTSTPAALNLPFDELHFADDASGQPQLTGWWIPSDTPAASTALLLHSGDGAMSDALPRALTLHNAHLNVLLFDYRGFGRSAGQHPTEDSMQSDAASALTFLTNTRQIAPRNIILYGTGVGASLAVHLAAAHPEISALILDAPDGDLADRAAHDPRSNMVPARWLFNQTFPLAAPLETLATPKLLISYNHDGHPPAALAHAADPRITVELASPTDPALVAAIQRFLDLYAPQPSPS